MCKKNICSRKLWWYCRRQKIYLHSLKVAAGGEELSWLEERLIAAAPQELQQVLSEVVDHLCGPAAVRLPEPQVFGADFDPVGQLRGDVEQLLYRSWRLLCDSIQWTLPRRQDQQLLLTSEWITNNKKQCKQEDSRCFSGLTCLLLLNLRFLPCWSEVRRRRPSSGVVCSPRCSSRTAHTSVLSVHFSLVSVLDTCRQPEVEYNLVYLLKYSNFRHLVLESYNLIPISASTLAETHHLNF